MGQDFALRRQMQTCAEVGEACADRWVRPRGRVAADAVAAVHTVYTCASSYST